MAHHVSLLGRGVGVAWCVVATSVGGCAGHDVGGDEGALGSATASVSARSTKSERESPPAATSRSHKKRKHHDPPTHDAGVSGAGDAAPDALDDGNAADAGAPPAYLRFASMGFDFPPFDVCVRRVGASEAEFTGPILRAGGLAAGLSPTEVSAYVPIPAGEYDVRMVAADPANCAVPLTLGTFSTLPVINAGEYLTAVATGSLGHLFFRIIPLVDELAGPGPRVRLVNATVPSPTLTIGVGTGDAFVPWISGVSNGAVGTPPETDAQGYARVEPVDGETLTLRVGGGTEFLHVPDFQLSDADVVTFFSMGVPVPGFKLITCYDAAVTAGPLSSCTVVTE